MRFGGLVLAVLLATTTVGCGGKAQVSDRDLVTKTVRSFLQAQIEGDGDAACSLLDQAGRRQLSQLVSKAAPSFTSVSCAQAISLARGLAGPGVLAALGKASVSSVEVTDRRAWAVVTDGPAFKPQPVALTKTDAGWRISSVPGLTG